MRLLANLAVLGYELFWVERPATLAELAGQSAVFATMAFVAIATAMP